MYIIFLTLYPAPG